LDLDRARRQLRVLLAGQAADHLSLAGDDPLAAQLAARLAQFPAAVRLEHHLGEAGTVAQVDKDEEVLAAAGVDPAVQPHRLADVRFPKLPTGVCSSQPLHDLAPCLPRPVAPRRTAPGGPVVVDYSDGPAV